MAKAAHRPSFLSCFPWTRSCFPWGLYGFCRSLPWGSGGTKRERPPTKPAKMLFGSVIDPNLSCLPWAFTALAAVSLELPITFEHHPFFWLRHPFRRTNALLPNHGQMVSRFPGTGMVASFHNCFIIPSNFLEPPSSMKAGPRSEVRKPVLRVVKGGWEIESDAVPGHGPSCVSMKGNDRSELQKECELSVPSVVHQPPFRLALFLSISTYSASMRSAQAQPAHLGYKYAGPQPFSVNAFRRPPQAL